jgi:hypothetical protein
MADRTQNDRPFWILNIPEEHSRKSVISCVARWMRPQYVLLTLADLFLIAGS